MSEVTRHEFAKLQGIVAALRLDSDNFCKWIKYLDGQRKLDMSNIEDISTRLASIDPVVARISAEVADMKAKLDAAAVEDPRIAAIADHAASILANLQAISPAPPEPVDEVAAEPVAEQPAQ